MILFCQDFVEEVFHCSNVELNIACIQPMPKSFDYILSVLGMLLNYVCGMEYGFALIGL